MRRLWPLPAFMRTSGGVIRKGTLALSGVELGSPASIHASTKAGWLPSLLRRTVTSPLAAGNTTRVPAITTLASALPTIVESAIKAAPIAQSRLFIEVFRFGSRRRGGRQRLLQPEAGCSAPIAAYR